MKQNRFFAYSITIVCALISGIAPAASAEPRGTLNDFYRPFELSEITPQNMQRWPYYK